MYLYLLKHIQQENEYHIKMITIFRINYIINFQLQNTLLVTMAMPVHYEYVARLSAYAHNLHGGYGGPQ